MQRDPNAYQRLINEADLLRKERKEGAIKMTAVALEYFDTYAEATEMLEKTKYFDQAHEEGLRGDARLERAEQLAANDGYFERLGWDKKDAS